MFVAKICERGSRQEDRIGPLNGIRPKSCWQLPCDAWWFSRVARINPVRVPSFLQVKSDAQQEFVARNNRLLLGEQCNLHVLVSAVFGVGDHREEKACRSNKKRRSQINHEAIWHWVAAVPRVSRFDAKCLASRRASDFFPEISVGEIVPLFPAGNFAGSSSRQHDNLKRGLLVQTTGWRKLRYIPAATDAFNQEHTGVHLAA